MSREVNSGLSDECLGALGRLGIKNKLKINWIPRHLNDCSQSADILAKRDIRDPLVNLRNWLITQEMMKVTTKYYISH